MRHGIWRNPFHRLGFRSSEHPQNSAPFSSSILGAEFPCCPVAFLPRNRTTEQVEVPPGSRRAVGHRIEECLPFSGIFDLLQLLRQVEVIPADDAVLMSRLQASSISWSSFSACRNSRGRDAGGVHDSEAAHLNSPKRALESQISMSHLVPLLEFNQNFRF